MGDGELRTTAVEVGSVGFNELSVTVQDVDAGILCVIAEE